MRNASMNLDLPDDDAALVRLVRRTGHAVLALAGVPDAQIYDIETVLGELCNNVCLYAHSPSGHFTVMLRCNRRGKITLIVTDFGAGFDYLHRPDPGMTTSVSLDGGLRYGGWGMNLVRDLCDEVVWSDSSPHGTTVRASKQVTGYR